MKCTFFAAWKEWARWGCNSTEHMSSTAHDAQFHAACAVTSPNLSSSEIFQLPCLIQKLFLCKVFLICLFNTYTKVKQSAFFLLTIFLFHNWFCTKHTAPTIDEWLHILCKCYITKVKLPWKQQRFIFSGISTVVEIKQLLRFDNGVSN